MVERGVFMLPEPLQVIQARVIKVLVIRVILESQEGIEH